MHLSKIFIWYIKEPKFTPHTILKTFNYKSNFLFVCWLFFCLKQYNIFASNVVFYIKLYIKNEHTMYHIIWKRMEEFTSSTQKHWVSTTKVDLYLYEVYDNHLLKKFYPLSYIFYLCTWPVAVLEDLQV